MPSLVTITIMIWRWRTHSVARPNRVWLMSLWPRMRSSARNPFEERGTMLMLLKLQARKAAINPLTLPTVEPPLNKWQRQWFSAAHYQAKRLGIIKIQKLLPFYNKANYQIRKLVNENSLLYQKELLSAVMMKDVTKSSQTLFPTNKLQTNSC